MTETISLSAIELDPAVNIRDSLDEETIQWYMEVFDSLPPVVAYRWNGQVLLADGFHRYAAAERLGKREITVEVREGSREDAWVYAATANFRNGRNLTLLERDRAIERVASLRPDWGERRVAEEFGISRATVRRARDAIRIQRDIGPQGAQAPYHQRTLAIASRAPDAETAGRLLEQAERSHWTRDELQAAVRTVNDPDMPPEYKERLLKGTAPPVLAGGRIMAGSIERIVSQVKKYDGIGAMWAVMNAVGRVREIGAERIQRQASRDDAAAILRLLPADIELLQDVRQRLEKV
jgi:ParB-like chromosome segregation protein Spo0J